FLRLELAGAVAIEARLMEQAPEALPRTLARHLDEAEIGDAVERRLRLVFLEELFESAPHLLAIFVLLHVDQIEDDQATDVPEAELVGDFVDGLEVRLEDRLLHVLAALAEEPPRIHVDRRERLCLVDDEVPAGRKRDLARERPADLVFDSVLVED